MLDTVTVSSKTEDTSVASSNRRRSSRATRQESPKSKESPTTTFIGKGKAGRRAYGFDEVALVPGSVTADVELCDHIPPA